MARLKLKRCGCAHSVITGVGHSVRCRLAWRTALCDSRLAGCSSPRPCNNNNSNNDHWDSYSWLQSCGSVCVCVWLCVAVCVWLWVAVRGCVLACHSRLGGGRQMRWAQGLSAARSQHDIFQHSRILRNTAFGLDPPRPEPPSVHFVGAIMPPHMQTKPLPRSLARFFVVGQRSAANADGMYTGVYVRLGSMPAVHGALVRALVQVA